MLKKRPDPVKFIFEQFDNGQILLKLNEPLWVVVHLAEPFHEHGPSTCTTVRSILY